jgi:hypothetical protein
VAARARINLACGKSSISLKIFPRHTSLRGDCERFSAIISCPSSLRCKPDSAARGAAGPDESEMDSGVSNRVASSYERFSVF